MTTWIVTTTIITRVETPGPGEAMEVARTQIEAQLPGSSISHQRSVHASREADMTARPDRALPPDAVVIRRTRHGWSAFSGDNITGAYGEDGLISSSDHVGPIAEYVLTLEPSEIIIQPGQGNLT